MNNSIQRLYSKGLLFSFILITFGTWTTAHASPKMKQFVLTTDMASGELISASQLKAAKDNDKNSIEIEHGVSMIEEFRSPNRWIQTFSATELADVAAYLEELNINSESLVETAFIHTPESVGGPKAADVPTDHNVYVIERDLPGAGDLLSDIRDEVAVGSLKAIAKVGDGIEWDHSYVTNEGIYCVYRATKPSLIKEHAQILEVPANPITQVEHIEHDFKFLKTAM